MQTGAARLGNSQHVGRLDGQAWLVGHPCAVARICAVLSCAPAAPSHRSWDVLMWQGLLSHSGVHPSHTRLLLLPIDACPPTTLLQDC